MDRTVEHAGRRDGSNPGSKRYGRPPVRGRVDAPSPRHNPFDLDPLDVWGCPQCHARLRRQDERTWRCTFEERTYPLVDAIPRLFHEDERDRAAADAEDFARTWAADDWSVPDDHLLTLPDVATGRHRARWEQKSAAVAVLRDLLSSHPRGRIGDLGAGIGWLSNVLRSWGHVPFAVDPCVDASVGLGRSRAYAHLGFPFPAAAGTLTHLPIQDGALDAAVCNASLHYVRDVDPVLGEVARVLRPGGVVYILNSPVHDDPRSARRAESDYRRRLRSLGAAGGWVDAYTHLVRDDLERALSRRFVSVTRIDPDYPPVFRALRRAKSALLRMELASFPVYAAERASSIRGDA